jgi:hypothetical protein
VTIKFDTRTADFAAYDVYTTEPPALTFAVEGERVAAISGGKVIQPAGE